MHKPDAELMRGIIYGIYMDAFTCCVDIIAFSSNLFKQDC